MQNYGPKVEQWLLDEESREKKSEYNSMDSAKLSEAEMENRNLRSELVEAQMKASLLQTQLSQKRKEYVDLCEVLRTYVFLSSLVLLDNFLAYELIPVQPAISKAMC